jgi:fumarate reductase flavoprotein subunit
VVIVGAGACGLVAALALAQSGAEVLIVERDADPSGSTSLSSGFIPAAGTRIQQQLQIQDTADLFAADIQCKANGEASSILVRTLTEQSGPVLDWLESHVGIEWLVLTDFLYPGHSVYRMHAVPEKSGRALHNRLMAAAVKMGVGIVTQARVESLIVTKSGDDAADKTVTGVGISRPDGAMEYIEAKQVILACNGYGGNSELIDRFIPAMADADYFGHAGNTGDAILWGEALGAELRHMGAYQGHGSVAVGHNVLITWALMMGGGIQVNITGERFSNEHSGYSEQAEQVMAQPERYVWNIYDERLHVQGLSFPEYKSAYDAGAVLTAVSIEELEKLARLPERALQQTMITIDRYAMRAGADQFGRRFDNDKRLIAPYFAIKVKAAVFHTQGGLIVDENARVINREGRPISGLLAAGGAACGVSGSSVYGYLSGNGLLSAVVLGYVAGRYAGSTL